MALSRWIKVPLAIAATLGALLALVVGGSVFMNERAASSAKKLCGSILAGTALDAAVSAATQAGARIRERKDVRDFFFQGSVFNGSTCRVALSGGRVTSTEVVDERD